MVSSLRSPKASGTSSNLTTTDPATPERQASSLPLDRSTTPRPSVRKDSKAFLSVFKLNSNVPGQHTLSPLPHRTVPPSPSPSRIVENSLAHPIFATTANVSNPEPQNSWYNITVPPTFIANATTGERPDFDGDSGFSDDTSDVTSLESGRLDPERHGSLEYAPNSDYKFPCDDEELSGREPLTHEAIWRLRKYHAKPFLGTEHLHLELFDEDPQKIIELGAGTCLWANNFGAKYPSAEVVAIDSNAIPLKLNEFETNVWPINDDVEERWTDREGSLDFVRAGNLVPSIKDRPELFRQSWRSLKPLARIEVIGFHYVPHARDGSEVKNGLFDFYQILAEAMSKANLDLNAITKTREELISAGFINVREEILRMPIGEWMEDPELKEIGELFELVVESGIPDIAVRAIEEELDWSPREVTVLGAKAKESLGSPVYLPLYIVTGQKPSNGNDSSSGGEG